MNPGGAGVDATRPWAVTTEYEGPGADHPGAVAGLAEQAETEKVA